MNDWGNEAVVVNDKGHPCSNDCCDRPDLITPEHECDEDFCEMCYGLECITCGSTCFCEL